MKDKKHYQSMMPKDIFDVFPFKADNKYELYKETKKFRKTMTSQDGLLTATYTAHELLGIQEMQVFAVVILNCIGEAKYDLTTETADKDKRAYGLKFDIKAAAIKIRGKSEEKDRESIVNSLKRLKTLDIFIEKKPAAPESDRRTRFADTKWIFEVLYDDEYKTADVLMGRMIVELANREGIGYSITQLQEYRGRKALLYFLMQGYKMKDEKIPNRYIYQNQVSHKRIVEAYDMESLSIKMQNARIREDFRDINLHFVKRGRYWVKTKRITDAKDD